MESRLFSTCIRDRYPKLVNALSQERAVVLWFEDEDKHFYDPALFLPACQVLSGNECVLLCCHFAKISEWRRLDSFEAQLRSIAQWKNCSQSAIDNMASLMHYLPIQNSLDMAIHLLPIVFSRLPIVAVIWDLMLIAADRPARRPGNQESSAANGAELISAFNSLLDQRAIISRRDGAPLTADCVYQWMLTATQEAFQNYGLDIDYTSKNAPNSILRRWTVTADKVRQYQARGFRGRLISMSGLESYNFWFGKDEDGIDVDDSLKHRARDSAGSLAGANRPQACNVNHELLRSAIEHLDLLRSLIPECLTRQDVCSLRPEEQARQWCDFYRSLILFFNPSWGILEGFFEMIRGSGGIVLAPERTDSSATSKGAWLRLGAGETAWRIQPLPLRAEVQLGSISRFVIVDESLQVCGGKDRTVENYPFWEDARALALTSDSMHLGRILASNFLYEHYRNTSASFRAWADDAAVYLEAAFNVDVSVNPDLPTRAHIVSKLRLREGAEVGQRSCKLYWLSPIMRKHGGSFRIECDQWLYDSADPTKELAETPIGHRFVVTFRFPRFDYSEDEAQKFWTQLSRSARG